MTTYTALTTTPGQDQAEQLGLALEAVQPAPTGIGVFKMEDGSGLWEVGGYFSEQPDDVALALLAAAYGARGFVISEVPDHDWVAHVRRELRPVEAGRFFVYGSHDAHQVPDDKIALLIEASMAFGTGHHATTLGCLLALDDLLSEAHKIESVIDVGCGTAVLAMASAACLQADIIASDIDPTAVEVAQTNIKANGFETRIKCLEATGFEHQHIVGKAPFDLIFANILKAPLIELAPHLAKACRKNGIAILSGILMEQTVEVQGIYQDQGFRLRQRRDIGDWSVLALQKG